MIRGLYDADPVPALFASCLLVHCRTTASFGRCSSFKRSRDDGVASGSTRFPGGGTQGRAVPIADHGQGGRREKKTSLRWEGSA